MNKNLIKIGSDVELFLQDKDTGKFLSGVGLIGGSKEDPRPLDEEGCCIQEDNVALEYNVPPVGLLQASTMWKNINFVTSAVMKVTQIPQNAELVCCSSAEFEEDQLQDPRALEFGCEPDFNAWLDGRVNAKPVSENIYLRSCGGHIHISYPDANPLTSMQLVKILDLFLGVPSIFIDKDTARRTLYGKAGAMRFKDWGDSSGFEYRVLSNWWTSSETYVKWVFDQISRAFDFLNANEIGIEIFANEIQEAINTSNTALAEVLCQEFNIAIPQLEETHVKA